MQQIHYCLYIERLAQNYQFRFVLPPLSRSLIPNNSKNQDFEFIFLPFMVKRIYARKATNVVPKCMERKRKSSILFRYNHRAQGLCFFWRMIHKLFVFVCVCVWTHWNGFNDFNNNNDDRQIHSQIDE